MNDFYAKAGQRIRNLREVNRYTREKLAELPEISPKFLYEIEVGAKGFSADTLSRIASALSVSCDYILSGGKQRVYGEDILDVVKLFDDTQQRTLSNVLKLMYELQKTK